ncbi:hypothetical protein Tco_1568130 [Tanacetum coccineum]
MQFAHSFGHPRANCGLRLYWCHDLSRSQKTKRELSSAAPDVLTTQPACHSSLVSCLSSLRESLPYVPGAYGQTLEALPSQPAVSGNESHIPGALSE